MDRGVNDNFKFNQETEFVPILGRIESLLNQPGKDNDPPAGQPTEKKASSIQDNHHSALLSLIAEELSVSADAVHDFEL